MSDQTIACRESFHFDGQTRWIRLEFAEVVELEPRASLREHKEQPVVINGRQGSQVVWCALPDQPGKDTFEREGRALRSGRSFRLSYPVLHAKLGVVDGTYLLPDDAQVPVVCNRPVTLEARVWRILPAKISGLRHRAPFTPPIRHARPPDRVQTLCWTQETSHFDLREVATEARSLLYLELHGEGLWLDAVWLDATGVGLTLLFSPGESRLLACDLSTGNALSQLHSRVALPGADGLFTVTEDSSLFLKLGGARWLVVSWPGGETCLPWSPMAPVAGEQARAYFQTDRQVYQTGETLTLCGWSRQRASCDSPWEELPTRYVQGVLSYRGGSYGNARQGLSKRLATTRWGGFLDRFAVEPQSDWEMLQVEVAAFDRKGDKATSTRFPDHRKLEYPESGCRLVLEAGLARFQAFQASGEAIVGLPVQMGYRGSGAEFSPPGYPGYRFHQEGTAYSPNFPPPRPPAPGERGDDESLRPRPQAVHERISGVTDRNGELTMPLPEEPAGSLEVAAVATLPEGRRAHVVQHQSREVSGGLFLGLKAWGPGFTVVVTDHRGILQTNVEITLRQGEVPLTKHLFTGQPLRLEWPVAQSGRLYVEARDQWGQVAVNSLVAQECRPGKRRPFPITLDGRFDKERYEESETARMSLFCDAGPAFALLRVFQGELIHQQTRRLTESQSEWSVPLGPRFLGTCQLRLDLITRHGALSREWEIFVEPTRYRLSVSVVCAPKTVAHGERASVEVVVLSPDGRPASHADVMLFVLSRSSAGVAGESLGDPLRAFYSNLPCALSTQSNLARSIHHDPFAPAGVTRSTAASQGPQNSELAAFRRATEPMVYSGAHGAGEDGKVSVEIVMTGQPDEFLVIALAAHNWTDFGRGQTELLCQQPALTLRVSSPDYLWVGDRPELPVRIQRRGNGVEEECRLFARSAGLAPASLGQSLILPQTGCVTVPHLMEARRAGNTVTQLAVVSGSASDRIQLKFPVYDFRAPREWALWGVLGSQPVDIPLHLDSAWEPDLSLEVWSCDPGLLLGSHMRHSDQLIFCAERVLVYLWAGDPFESQRDLGEEPLPSDLASSLASLLRLHRPDGAFFTVAGLDSVEENFYHLLLAARAVWEAQRRGHPIDADRLRATLQLLQSRTDAEWERSYSSMPEPWHDIHDELLEDMGLASRRTHRLERVAISPISQVSNVGNVVGPVGDWTLLETLEPSIPRLAFWTRLRLAKQLSLAPFRQPVGTFRFGSEVDCLGELTLNGPRTKATRWALPTELGRLRLVLEGEGNVYYRLLARGKEPADCRTPGYGLARRLLNGRPPDQDGQWSCTVGDQVEVQVAMALRETSGLRCYLPKPAAFVNRSRKEISLCENGYGGFRFNFEVRHPGRYVFPPAWVEGPQGVIARTDWHTLVVSP